MTWEHLNTAPKDKEFFAHSRSWKRPQFVRLRPDGQYESCVTRRKVIPQVWMNIPRFA